MFNWIRRMYDSVAGRIDNTVRGWVNDLINGLYGFLHVIFGAVANGWVRLWANTDHWVTTFEMLCVSVYNKLYNIVRRIIPAIVAEYRTLIHNLTVYAQAVYHDLLAGLAYAASFTQRLVDDALKWVRDNVYAPLLRAFLAAWQWITHEGATIWDYITHPDKLAELLFGSLIALLEREAWSVADRLGRFFLALIVRNLPRFAALIEDILQAIL